MKIHIEGSVGRPIPSGYVRTHMRQVLSRLPIHPVAAHVTFAERPERRRRYPLEAERATWAAPGGGSHVENLITIRPKRRIEAITRGLRAPGTRST